MAKDNHARTFNLIRLEEMLRQIEVGSNFGAIHPSPKGLLLGRTCFICQGFREDGAKGKHLPGCSLPKMLNIVKRLRGLHGKG